MILAIDFDGTLCTNMFPKIGNPVKPVIAWCKERKQAGDKLILWTCRTNQRLSEAVEWCKKNGLEFDSVNENLEEIIQLYGGDTRKIQADHYLDDKNLSITEILGKEVRSMKCEIRADGLHISGYVNVPGKMSRPVITGSGRRVVEVIEERAFQKALDGADNVTMLLDHREDKLLAGTKEKTLELREDSIGLHANTVITDPETIAGAKAGKLKGWSFGMKNVVDSIEDRGTELPLRHVKSFILDHVSLIMNKTPCYAATSVELRGEDESITETRASDEDVEMVETPKKEIDYTPYQDRINKLI